MKKVFVLYICFCLLFSQSVFAIENTLPLDQGHILDVKKETIKSENEIGDKQSLENEQEEKDTQNDSDRVVETPFLDTKSTMSAEENIETSSTEKNVELDQESVNAENKKQNTTQSIDINDSKTDTVGTGLKPVPTAKEADVKLCEKDIKLLLTINTEKIRLNEILANPDGTDSGNEFIELYNDGNVDVSLKNWCLHNKTQKCYDFGDVTIKSKGFLTLYNKADFSFSLNNSNEEIYLKDINKNIVSDYSYAKSTSGLSWNYDNDAWYEETPTPDTQNNDNPLTKEYPNLIINELLPNPMGNENSDEFIEIYNPTDDPVNLKGWILKDATTSGKYIFPQTEILSQSYIAIYRSSFGFALNNSGNETVSLVAPNTKIISSISYTKTKEGLSYNRDNPMWYWELPTPNTKNNENPLTKEYPQIFINEILPNPSESEEAHEFIELYNPTDGVISLKNWIITDASSTGSYTFMEQEILPQSHFTIYRSDFKFALNNSGVEVVSLLAPNNKTVSTISYNETREGISLNRASQWYHAQPTPNKENAINPRTIDYPKLLLSELLSNPSGPENTNEFIEIYNPNDTKVNLKNWLLKDASKTGSYTFSGDTFVAPHTYFVIYRKNFSFALNNSDETVSLIAPNEKVMDVISYASASEDVSYNYEHASKKWRWSKHLTPAKQNIFNNLPILTKFNIDKKAYKDVYVEFDARANDIDNEELKVRWDFGDEHKSYIWKTRHKYTKTGIYHGHLRVQDGSEEIIQNFTVTVKKYPKHKMRITQIVPNPSGKDSGIEYIIIKNKSKKKINLKNWSIATGSSKKTIVNHPISKKLIIRPGKSKVITKKYAAISLPNKTGIVEIRRPNGSVADTVEYGDKSTSIPDNASYEETDGVWQWIIPENLEKIAQTSAIITQAIANEQIFSQQKLEQFVAISAVYSQDESFNALTQGKRSFLSLLIQKINNILHTSTTLTQKIITNTNDLHQSISITQIYFVPHTKNPCTKPFIFSNTPNSKFNFCN